MLSLAFLDSNKCCVDSVKDLETQVSELEAESERVSQALEAQKLATSETEAAGNKKTEEISKAIQKKVCLQVFPPTPPNIN